MFEHEHPLNLIDLWAEQLQHEQEYEENEEEMSDDELIANQDFRSLCFQCGEEINWFHRYYFTCYQCSDFFIHKFCTELPERMEDICHAHTLCFLQRHLFWLCDICHNINKPHNFSYHCSQCDFDLDEKCATKRLQKNIIHHPSHTHPLVCMTKQILCECDACGKEHKGIFYHCSMCAGPFIHSDCALLPQKLLIQHATNDFFSHIHHLTLAFSFPKAYQNSKFNPSCRICRKDFSNENLWIYKCEKCRYYTHLSCATSRNEPFMSILAPTDKIIKNYEDDEHPYLFLHLPFPDPSYSTMKQLFFKEDGLMVTTTRISHQHPLILKDARCTDITSPTYHDPMKRTELLCNGCVRPITSGPIYVCANEEEHCNFVLHEWCSRLPAELDHPGHSQHTLVLQSDIHGKFFGVFFCDICMLPCNGFAYYCQECKYYIDVNCAFLPKKITHNSHPNHLLSRVYYQKYVFPIICYICGRYIVGRQFSFSCHSCDFHLHLECALLIPMTIRNKCDKHSMKLNYRPIENHKSDYFCEICEERLNPERSFYHCRECMQSVDPACAPLILGCETYTSTYSGRGIYYFLKVKFGGIYKNLRVHIHPLSFVQGIESDGNCEICGYMLQYNMIFKCSHCMYAVHKSCCESLSA